MTPVAFGDEPGASVETDATLGIGPVWYVPGSPLAREVASAMPGLDLRALPEPSRGRPLSGVLIVDARTDHTSAQAGLPQPDLPVIAVVDHEAPVAAPPGSYYAYLTRSLIPHVLPTVLRDAATYARQRARDAATQAQLKVLNAIGVQLSAEHNVKALLELILSQARALTQSDAGSIYIVENLESEGRCLRFALAQNDSVSVPFAQTTLPISPASVAGHVAMTGETVCIENAYDLPAGGPFRINTDFDARLGYRTISMLVVPMTTPAGDMIGVLQLINRKHDPGQPLRHSTVVGEEVVPYTRADRDIAASLASQAAVAIRNAQLAAELATRNARVERLVDWGQTLWRLEPTSLPHRIAEACGRLLDCESVTFRVREGDELVVAGTWGESLLPRERLKIGEGLSGLAAAEGTALSATDLAHDPRIEPSQRAAMLQHGDRALLALPVTVENRVVAVLGIRTNRREVFSAQDLAVATLFATQAGHAMDNSRLFQELDVALRQIESSQQQLVQAERLGALGEMAAGVAHDFNNLLQVVVGRAQLLLMSVEDPRWRRDLETIRKAALDGAHTLRRIQEFTRTRHTQPFAPVDLVDLVRDVLDLTRGRWQDDATGHGIVYDVSLEDGPVPVVQGVPEELREVVMNLVLNALEAMPEGGRLRCRVSADGATVAVSVTDTGSGMTDETKRRVLEPFFTTKGPRGTGLGLAVSWGIVKRHGGSIAIDSALGHGSTFTVRLPTTEGAGAAAKLGPTQPARQARVLVVDDDDAVRQVLRDLLVTQGHTVLEANSGATALARCDAGSVDLILTDVSMPGMTGWDVATACQQQFPEIPVGFVTGWGDQLDPERAKRCGVRFVLTKPVGGEELHRHMSDALTA
jgi:signal transduction histidine kinase/CheY-like chemotaxis protein